MSVQDIIRGARATAPPSEQRVPAPRGPAGSAGARQVVTLRNAPRSDRADTPCIATPTAGTRRVEFSEQEEEAREFTLLETSRRVRSGSLS